MGQFKKSGGGLRFPRKYPTSDYQGTGVGVSPEYVWDHAILDDGTRSMLADLKVRDQFGIVFYQPAVSGSNYVKLTAPSSLSSSITLILPPTDGDQYDILMVGSTGNMYWTGELRDARGSRDTLNERLDEAMNDYGDLKGEFMVDILENSVEKVSNPTSINFINRFSITESPTGVAKLDFVEHFSRNILSGLTYVSNLADDVGIGTVTPTEKLDVVGNIGVSGTVDGVDVSVLNGEVVDSRGSKNTLDERLDISFNEDGTLKVALQVDIQEDGVTRVINPSGINFEHGLDVVESPAGIAQVDVNESELDHGLLSGKGNDTHTQYLLADGSRNLGGNIVVDPGVTIDGVIVSNHHARHENSGADEMDLTGLVGLVHEMESSNHLADNNQMFWSSSSGTVEDFDIGASGCLLASNGVGNEPIWIDNIIMGNGKTIGQVAGPLLTFDDTNNYLGITGCNVGIGTASPSYVFHTEGSKNGNWVAKIDNVNSTSPLGLRIDVNDAGTAGRILSCFNSSSEVFSVRNDGNVGIGTDSPNSLLSVGDPVVANPGANRPQIGIGNSDGDSRLLMGQDATHSFVAHWVYNATAGDAYMSLDTFGGNNDMALQVSGGKLGIGESAPDSTLEVNGTGHFTGALTVDDNTGNVKMKRITINFARAINGATVQAGGILVDTDGEATGASFLLPDDCTNIETIRIAANIWAATGTGDGMNIALNIDAGKDNQSYSAHNVGFTNLLSKSLDYAQYDHVYWEIPYADLGGIQGAEGGDLIIFELLHEAADGDGDETNASFGSIEIEYS